jgi:hypothetical protein
MRQEYIQFVGEFAACAKRYFSGTVCFAVNIPRSRLAGGTNT